MFETLQPVIFIVRCAHCGREGRLSRTPGCGLKVGNPVMYDASSPDDTTCKYCHRDQLIVVAASTTVQPTEVSNGFTKIPTR